jgi:hypothetical protein
VDGLRQIRPHRLQTRSNFLMQAISQRLEGAVQPLVKFH